jgi:DNA-binding transcriptional regulator GbsR (MarR family)
MPFEAFEVQEGDDKEYHNAYLDFMQNNHTFDDSFIERKKDKKKKKLTNLDDFIGDDNDDTQIDTRLDS